MDGRQSKHIREFKTPDDHQRLQRFTKRDTDLGAMQKTPSGSAPEPVRGSKGASYLGPHNPAVDLQNMDEVAGPPTDSGTVVNLKWTFSQSRTTLLNVCKALTLVHVPLLTLPSTGWLGA
jgi:hypothetical protein